MTGSKGRGFAGCVVVAMWVVTGAWQAAAGQASDAPVVAVPASKPLGASVRVLDNQAEHIYMTVGKSAIIESSAPVQVASVVNPEVAEVTPVSPQMTMLRGKAFGTTEVVLVAGDGRQRAYMVSVGMDVSNLEAAIREVSPQAKIRVTAMLDTVVLSGTVPDAESAQQIAQIAQIFSPKVQSHLRVAGVHQVMLRCTVAEVSRSAIRQLGFNGYAYGKDFFGVNQINQINPVSIGSPAGLNIERPQTVISTNPPVLQPNRFFFTSDAQAFPQSTLYFGLPRAQTQIFVQAMSENGLLKVLAEPNLVAISGQTASFLAGGEFPVPVPQDQDTVTIEWRRFGVQLGFTPAVLPGERIRLKVAPEVSELDFSTAVQFSGFVIPGLTNRRAETVVEVGSGQTFAIAGLLSDQVRATVRRVPGIGDVPVLGALFASKEFRKNQTELMILVTPELVSPLDPDQVPPVPGQQMTDPNDWQFYGLGMLEGEPQVGPIQAAASQPVPDPSSSAGLYGSYGPSEYDEAP